ncbi:hypothetical protein [Streptomyces sp. S1]|uniref:hypothetical protein n=1 Tax=Streptomyces sp. S1 TaxID=718288 RepID=UPI003D706426
MKRDIWIWTIGHEPSGIGFFVELAQHTLLDEALSWLGGALLKYSVTWRLANWLIVFVDGRREVLLRLAISEDQARRLGWGE